MKIEYTENDVAGACASYLDRLLLQYSDRRICLLLSGGSALDVYEAMDVGSFGSHVSISLVDERLHVDAVDQNFAQLENLDFTREVLATGAFLINPAVQASLSLNDAQAKYSDMLEGVANDFDAVVALLGIGSDGHTAGIMPYPEDKLYFTETFCDEEKLAIAYDVGQKNPLPQRVTASASFLMHRIDHCAVYVVGDSKSVILKEIVSDSNGTNIYPARIIHAMKDAHLFTDQEIN